MAFDPRATALFVAKAHQARAAYTNVPSDVAPANVAEAYAAQEALAQLWQSTDGPVVGRKIATTTKIMQELMGIDHPCGGVIFARRVHASPASIVRTNFVHLVIECELAVRLAVDMPSTDEPYDRASARKAVGTVMSAFELIEDRHAVYKDTQALSLIADNAWNGGIVLGPEQQVPAGLDLNGRTGTLAINGENAATGRTDDPMGALAWVANLAITRGAPLKAGMVVITGSVIPTRPIGTDETFRFTIDGLEPVVMTAA
jgi:2-keto-4-pentenoate hydratase